MWSERPPAQSGQHSQKAFGDEKGNADGMFSFGCGRWDSNPQWANPPDPKAAVSRVPWWPVLSNGVFRYGLLVVEDPFCVLPLSLISAFA